jgi:hypothetical protein
MRLMRVVLQIRELGLPELFLCLTLIRFIFI